MRYADVHWLQKIDNSLLIYLELMMTPDGDLMRKVFAEKEGGR